ncbi:MAG: DUF4065 domain-containing protein [Hyphomicrobiales bacterium]|nr:DUF4065 domain-containing protein [Hyphomicrobiales bacterium]
MKALWLPCPEQSVGEGLTNLQVQKILYFANMLHIGTNGPDNPLIRGRFLTWVYGPAVRELYEHMSRCEKNPVETAVFDDIVPIMDKDTKEPKEEKYRSHVDILKKAYEIWGKYSPYKLIQRLWTGQPGSLEGYVSDILSTPSITAFHSCRKG